MIKLSDKTNVKPKIGRSPRLLGVRLGIDIDVETIPRNWLYPEGYLRSHNEQVESGEKVEVALRNHKGMSVALSIDNLPRFRKPPEFRGTGKDRLWQIEDHKISGDLEAVQDSPTHVSIMPKQTMLLEKYEIDLCLLQITLCVGWALPALSR